MRPVGDLGVERDGHSGSPSTQQVTASGSNSMMPACTAIGNDTLPTTIDRGDAGGEAPPPRVEPGVVPAHRLEQATRRRGTGGCRARCWRRCRGSPPAAAQAGVDVAVGGATHEVGVEPAPREVGEVEDQEQHDDDAGPAHRAAGEVGGHVVARRLVLDRAGLAVQHGERVGGVDVEHAARRSAPRRMHPQEVRCGAGSARGVAEELAVDVDVVHRSSPSAMTPRYTLRLPTMWANTKPIADDPGDRHHVLLADGRRVEVAGERLLLRRRLDGGARDRARGSTFVPCRETTPTGARTPNPHATDAPPDRCRHANAVRLEWRGHSLTKSINCSTAPTSSGRRSAKVFTRLRSVGQKPSNGTPSARTHALLPRHVALRHVGPLVEAEHLGADAGPHVDERVPGDQHVRISHRLLRCGSPSSRAPDGRAARRVDGRRSGRTRPPQRRGRRRRGAAPRRCRARAGRRPTRVRAAPRRACPRPRSGWPPPLGPGRRRRPIPTP